jgi:hypothetical protein
LALVGLETLELVHTLGHQVLTLYLAQSHPLEAVAVAVMRWDHHRLD